MLFAARESAVTKKPRLRFTMSRSSSVRPFGSFHRAMSRFMFTSCGIQWFAQADRYFSQAHLYLKGTSWLTSVVALMTRLSSARTRVCAGGADTGAGVGTCAGLVMPEGVEWIVCRPTVGTATGESSSKLNMLMVPLAFDCAPLFMVVRRLRRLDPLPGPLPKDGEKTPRPSPNGDGGNLPLF